MIGRLALRSLAAHPVRTAVLAAGFGIGVSVMAILLGVAEIVLDQARAPALVGGGDVLISPAAEVPARVVLAGTLQRQELRSQIRVAAPNETTSLYLLHGGKSQRVRVRAGIPSLERALGDTETAGIAAWRDSPDDTAWTQQSPESMLQAIDRFHPVPEAPTWQSSWAEWLYFNGRAGDARFYLTFLVGSATADGRRNAGVRLQLDRGGGVESFSEGATLTEADALAAPNLTIGRNSVRLEGLRYRIHLDLRSARGETVRGELTIDASPGRLVPPFEISGARGWRTGYVVPVMSGALGGMLNVGRKEISFAGGTGYHDHNWGFWEGVSWQWGQVQQGDLSLLYGRVFPPTDAADPERLPGFVGVLGPDGPLGYTRDVTIAEVNDARGQPQSISVQARSTGLDVEVRFDVESVVVTRGAGGALSSGLDFFQMRGDYTVKGRAGDRTLNFSAPGSAETFRDRATKDTKTN
jgi:hypothetical protein